MIRRAFLAVALAVFSCAALAQAPAAKPQPAASQPPHSQAAGEKKGEPESVAPATPRDTRKANELEREGTSTAAGIRAEEAHVSREAAGEGGEDAQFRESPSVRTLSRITGIPLKSAYWVFIALNFAILAFILYLLSKSRIPAMFRARTSEIRKSLDEAQRSSAEANRRLSDIETRLARLDTEVAEMRAQAEREAEVEEQRIREAAEADQNRIVHSAQTEIEALSKNARRELKSYAADLAVALAEKRIKVDQATDQRLVRSFTDQLGGDGKGRS